jgi:hypothetical protein
MYTLQSLLEEVAKKRGRLLDKTKSPGQPSEDYAQVWDTFNRYVTACMAQKKGVNVTNFCRVGWKLETKRQNKVQYRPYFQLADSFCSAYNVDESRRAPVPPEKELCSMEEFNFSKAAIKFSQTLTKDMMFTGLRSIVQSLGEAIAESKTISADFEFGRLTCQNNDPRFVFAAQLYTQEGLSPPKDALDKLSYQPSVSFMPPSKDALSLNIAGNKAGAPSEPQPDQSPGPQTPAAAPSEVPIPRTPPPPGYDVERSLPPSRGGESVAGLSDTKPSHGRQTPFGSERSTAASSQRSRSMADLQGGGAASDVSGGSVGKEEAAYREAMDRHISEMEQRAAMAVFEKKEWEGHIHNCLMQEKDDIGRRRALCEANSDFVKQQMAWNADKRKDGRKTFIENASAHDFPVFTEPPDNELQEQMRNQQQRLRSDLDTQVRTNNTLRNLARQRERELEHNQLEANRQEMAMLRSLDKSKKDHQKEVLSMAWNRDVRMRNIWKAIDGHVNSAAKQSGIDINQLGGDTGVPATPSLASGRSGSLPSLGRAMTGSQRRVPTGASMNLEKQKQKLARGLA